MARERFTLEAVIRFIDQASAPVTRIANRVGKATRKIRRGLDAVNKRLKSIGKTAKAAIGVGLAGAFAGVVRGMGAVIRKGADFEKSIVGAAARFGINAGTDPTGKRLQSITDIALEMGAQTEFSATQAAEALKFFAKAGFSAELSMGLLPGVIDLATAGELDLARATDIATDALGAFGLVVRGDVAQTQKNFTKLSDQMSVTMNKSNQSLEQLFETIKTGAPAATAAGFTVEEFLATTALLAGSGIKAEKAGTQMRNVFLKLADTKVQKRLRDLGVSVADAAGKTRPFADIIQDLGKGLAGRTDFQRAGILKALFDVRGVTPVAILLKQGTAAFKDMEDQIRAADGAMAALAAQLRATTAVELKLMSSAIDGLVQSLFIANREGISNLIGGVTRLAGAVQRFTVQNPELTKAIGIFTAIAVAAVAVAAAVAAIAFIVAAIASSTVALGAAFLTVTAGVVAWLASLESVQRWFENFFALGFLEKLGALVDLTGGIGAFVATGGATGNPFAAPATVTPQERIASVSEIRQKSTAELLVRAERGSTAELIGSLGGGIDIQLEATGTL